MDCIYCGKFHTGPSEVIACMDLMEAEIQAEGHAEQQAELAAERWFEERGGNYRNQIEEDMEHSPFDPIWAL